MRNVQVEEWTGIEFIAKSKGKMAHPWAQRGRFRRLRCVQVLLNATQIQFFAHVVNQGVGIERFTEPAIDR